MDLLVGTAATSSSTSTQPVADIEIIERSLQTTSDMIDRVISYVQSVLSGEKQGDAAIGRYLMDTLGAATDDLEKSGFNSSLQVRSYPLECRDSHIMPLLRIPSRSHTLPTSYVLKPKFLHGWP